MKLIILYFALMICTGSSFAATQYVYNVTNEELVFEYASDVVRPIASVTKLMTALVVVSDSAALDVKVRYGRLNKTREDLLYLMLVRSDNKAAESLAAAYPGGRIAFIERMNTEAKYLGMNSTTYNDPSGLSRVNQSTAKDLAILLRRAYTFDKIREIASTASYTVVDTLKKRKRVATINNTNVVLLKEFKEIEISKTGFTNPAGKCLVLFLTKNETKYIIVILGEYNTRSVQAVSRHIIKSL